MNLYFLRHGKAEEHSNAKADRSRHLIERGFADARLIAGFLKNSEITFDAIYTSPYPRASETARVVAQALEAESVFFERPELEAGSFEIDGLQTLTCKHKTNAHLLFVGHEPDLSEVIQLLCGAECDMKTAGLAYISLDRVEPSRGVLHWLLSPKLIQMEIKQENPSAESNE